ncbi:c-type cytochrome [Aquicella lusitana]|uniref:Cytochrome c5 n=1 Tax=Aquicella lusitana TaxID=254246 RepID=A0A370GHS5_9COXI|nr:c-type cytochrome [Aquicella lusitana]RDI43358.1 cytochrome c5 [Aquicella lusitana]VVC73508.1 Cytochrome c5 [Aquicella lusitana]
MQKRTKSYLIVLIFALSGVCGFSLSLYQYSAGANSAVDAIRVTQTVHYPAIRVRQLLGDPQAGEKIFNEFCATCHAAPPLVDVNAPRIGDKKRWQTLRRVNTKTLLAITLKGAGAMPARGGCFECSDEQLQAAIQYMVDKSK